MRTKKEVTTFLQMLYTDHFGAVTSAVLVSAPGRVELAGNHTDHQGGRTISAAIDQRAWALAAPNDSDSIHVYMDGFGKGTLSLSSLDTRPAEEGTSIALIRGMAAAFALSGKPLRGFNIVTCSDIPVGSGLSSSAAFEVLIGAVIRALFDPDTPQTPSHLIALAFDGVFTEQHYFGKPCGAQDQLASAYGGIVAMDFASDIPQITEIDLDINAYPYSICLIDSKSDHSHHTSEFGAIPADMFAVAQFFEHTKLEEVDPTRFLKQLPQVRAHLGDRAALRAIHYFAETKRVLMQQQALAASDFEKFLEGVRLSGSSSAQFLQNVSPRSDAQGTDQPAMIILALCAQLLENSRPRGAYRIHGGGFGGSVLAFVPSQQLDTFKASLNEYLGYDACISVAIGGSGVQAERLA